MWKNIDPEVLSTRPHSSRAEIWSQKGMWFVFFFFFSPCVPKRKTRRGMENHFFSYMSSCQTLKPCTCCRRHRDKPFPLTSQRKLKNKGQPFPSHPFFISSLLLRIGVSVVFKNTSWQPLSCLFSLPPCVESCFSRKPRNLRWQWYWLYLTDWWMAKINKTSRRAPWLSASICYN